MKLFVIDTLEKLVKEVKLVESLGEIEIANKIVEKQKNSSEDLDKID